MKQRIQLGLEGFKGSERVFRVTPLDVAAEVKPEISFISMGVESMLDMRDAQPGDGEIDIPVSIEQAKKMFPWLGSHIGGVDRVNMFFNLK